MPAECILPGMGHRPAIIAFDVIETLFPLDPIREKLIEAGLPGTALPVWFARLLRDAIGDGADRSMTLSNGSAESTRKLLEKAGIDRLIERVISIDEVRHWKPARAVYLYAAQAARVEVHQMALVAAHAWDIQGGHVAGLTTGWLPRQEKQFSPVMHNPDVKGGTLPEVVTRLLELPTGR